ncbi:hypothetical protein [uncultured Flavobacterium sp.]|uniref:hypothetical protein n=1 Tax=uncultured Flavobacterium sp. TaxID=165435 RepID=UPI0027E07415|nr:hypothetical protein [uncultured Flavobacterium sp.]
MKKYETTAKRGLNRVALKQVCKSIAEDLSIPEEQYELQLIKTGNREFPKRLAVYIPNNLDLERHIEQYPPEIQRFHIDKLAYIVSLIYAIPVRLKDYDFVQEDGYVPLNSTVLRARVREYDKYLEYLVNTGIFEKREGYKYLAGEKSSGYRFTSVYNVDHRKRYITRSRLIKAILTVNKKEEQKYVDITEQPLEYLDKWWNEKLHFDYYKAKQWLENLYLKELAQNKPHCERRYFVRKLVLEKLKNREYIIHQDSTTGRVHNLFTQLKSELRQFITYDGKKLVAVDITNSQPFLSLALLNQEAFNNTDISTKLTLYNPSPSIPSSIMLTLSKDSFNANEDLVNFIEFVSSGEFYEMFGQLLLKKGLTAENDLEALRKITKEIMFASMFGHNNEKMKKKDKETGKTLYVPNEGMILFKETFPTVFEIFRKIKQGKHNALACVLQNLEAELVLHRACRIISEENPEVPIYTLHDAIITTEDNANYVKRVLSEVLLEAIGIEPTIKLEHWEEKMEAA